MVFVGNQSNQCGIGMPSYMLIKVKCVPKDSGTGMAGPVLTGPLFSKWSDQYSLQ